MRSKLRRRLRKQKESTFIDEAAIDASREENKIEVGELDPGV